MASSSPSGPVMMPVRAGNDERVSPTQTAEGLQQPRQAEKVVSVIMCQGNEICFHQADMSFSCSGLGAFTAIEKDGATAERQMHGSERTFRQGHCCGSAEKSDINHGKSGRNPQITELETDMDEPPLL